MSRKNVLRFERIDYENTDQARDLVSLLDDYARDPMGGGEPLSACTRENLAATLAATPNAFSIIGYRGEQAVALANCFVTLSTFACQPLINIHDLAVSASYRGLGIGSALLDAVADEARSQGACKITLEVLEGNGVARAAYAKAGFEPYVLDETMGGALFLQRVLT